MRQASHALLTTSVEQRAGVRSTSDLCGGRSQSDSMELSGSVRNLNVADSMSAAARSTSHGSG